MWVRDSAEGASLLIFMVACFVFASHVSDVGHFVVDLVGRLGW